MTDAVIRQVPCGGCGAPAGKPCVNYPSGRQATMSHTARYYSALDAGLIQPPTQR